MRFNMGLNMMDMVEVVYGRLADVKFPFLVMHDPEDGEKETRQMCKTFAEKPRKYRSLGNIPE